ncbi:DUF6894 family protein [Methylobacterium haplocladii]|uniref:DUF6894 domain-containing protein n=1 Tax=Methylobacterium haplocladii TaxID=1176176 RepID=A0A512IQE0_9HYPH|nr:hypothetical protein [Methylobacterium haplocladii]GEO99900.1 hypothetical protein MHA02_22880 [Methylobacterium haplocladii]GJD82741.1 hypothetical protein HPGCJGGD_0601 [Methylobacterium haplocladii]GLS58064.1 hypothetical protein GCM10007887_07200 [Methylobacterium haplocladii]
MPRYFFDVHDGVDAIDDAGQDLPDLPAAEAEAVRIAGNFATRPAMLGAEGGALVVVVRNAPDCVALKVRLVFNIDKPWKRQRVPVASTA